MTVMNVAEAQEKFPELVDLVANKHEDDIIIMINGIPAVKIVRCTPQKRTGHGKDKFIIPDDWDAKDEEIMPFFSGAK